MNRIVREDYPVAELPEDLRAGLSQNIKVRVIIEASEPPAAGLLSLDELWAMRRGPFKSPEEIAEETRRLRDELDE